MSQQTWICPHCHKPNVPSAPTCSQCGSPHQMYFNSNIGGSSRMTNSNGPVQVIRPKPHLNPQFNNNNNYSSNNSNNSTSFPNHSNLSTNVNNINNNNSTHNFSSNTDVNKQLTQPLQQLNMSQPQWYWMWVENKQANWAPYDPNSSAALTNFVKNVLTGWNTNNTVTEGSYTTQLQIGTNLYEIKIHLRSEHLQLFNQVYQCNQIPTGICGYQVNMNTHTMWRQIIYEKASPDQTIEKIAIVNNPPKVVYNPNVNTIPNVNGTPNVNVNPNQSILTSNSSMLQSKGGNISNTGQKFTSTNKPNLISSNGSGPKTTTQTQNSGFGNLSNNKTTSINTTQHLSNMNNLPTSSINPNINQQNKNNNIQTTLMTNQKQTTNSMVQNPNSNFNSSNFIPTNNNNNNVHALNNNSNLLNHMNNNQNDSSSHETITTNH